ncbi:MAG: chemotaxis protein CheW [Candidatus Eiseniibacteriota bacterium]
MSAPPGPFVTFRLDGAEYAFALTDVVELTRVLPITPVPRTADRVLGVATWRGKTIAVLDVAAHLKRRPRTPDARGRLLVIGRPDPFAVLIGEPGRLLRAEDATPVELPDAAGPGETAGISLVRTAGGLVRVVDPACLLGDPPTLLAEGR